MKYFVDKGSIVREIWGKSDTILFIFAGSAAEFALNKAVDWLFYTGRLPADPLGRLFSTVAYARQIVFSELETANRTIDKMAAIHAGVEASRGARIPDWAYRDVLFMLIDYSIRSFELLERKLTKTEKEEVFQVFFRVGSRMELTGLPLDFQSWATMRVEHLEQNLQKSKYTIELYQQYRKHLGSIRYHILLMSQEQIVPERVKMLLDLKKALAIKPMLMIYKLSRLIKMDWLPKAIILPSEYKKQINELNALPK